MGKPQDRRAINALVALVIVVLAPVGLALVWIVDLVRWKRD